MPTLVLVAAALLVAGGLAVIALLVLQPTKPASGVAKSLEIIERSRPQTPEFVAIEDRPASARIWLPLGRSFGRLGRRITPVGTPARLQRRLDLAGNPPGWTVERLIVLKGVGACVGVLLGLLALLVHGTFWGFVFAGGLVALGYWITDILLYNTGLKRQDEIRKVAADAIDMLTICVEAGLSFDAGLSQVARNTSGPLAADLARLLQEMQIGRSRAEAFSEFAARTTVAELKNFVTALVQADRLGVPIASVLREQSSEMRLKRRQHAEEKAQKVPVKILFPVIFCVFPALLIVVIGPGAIRIYEVFAHQ